MQTTMHVLGDSWLGRGHMMGDMGRSFFFFFPGGLFGLLTTIGLFLLLIWVASAWLGNRRQPVPVAASSGATATSTPLSSVATPSVPARQTPFEALQLRYARGEISRAEYATIRQDLLRDDDTKQAPTTGAATTPTPPPSSNESPNYVI